MQETLLKSVAEEDLKKWKHAVTRRNAGEYEEWLGMSENELWSLLSNKVVMDLASGLGIFGADVALASYPGSSWQPPKRLDMVDIQYANPDYEASWKKRIENFQHITDSPAMISLPPSSGHKKIQFPYDDEVVQTALKKANEWRKAFSWNDLSELPNDYELILSSFGFPYYSEIAHPLDASYPVLIDEESRGVFKQIVGKLVPGGKFIGYTNFSEKGWKSNQKYQNEMTSFFDELGCKVEIVGNKYGNAIMHVTRIEPSQN